VAPAPDSTPLIAELRPARPMRSRPTSLRVPRAMATRRVAHRQCRRPQRRPQRAMRRSLSCCSPH